MPAINFQPRFADLVESGRKTQTIRKSNRFKVGDTVQLYTGQRTKQCRKLGEGVVTSVRPIGIGRDKNGAPFVRLVWPNGRDNFLNTVDIAMLDGFETAQEMVTWFEEQHGLPFDGWLIKWRLNR